MNHSFQTIEWIDQTEGLLRLLDQTRLPAETVYLECRTVEEVWHAIRRLSVRGAAAIGVAAAYGVCVGVQSGRSVDEVCDYLATSRPTAVNLFWALERMRRRASRGAPAPGRGGGPPGSPLAGSDDPTSPSESLVEQLLVEAQALHAEDRELCAAMGRHGADLLADLPAGAGIPTPRNT